MLYGAVRFADDCDPECRVEKHHLFALDYFHGAGGVFASVRTDGVAEIIFASRRFSGHRIFTLNGIDLSICRCHLHCIRSLLLVYLPEEAEAFLTFGRTGSAQLSRSTSFAFLFSFSSEAVRHSRPAEVDGSRNWIAPGRRSH